MQSNGTFKSAEMRNVLLDLKQRNVHVILMSDANTFYIDTILKVTSKITYQALSNTHLGLWCPGLCNRNHYQPKLYR